MEQVGFLPKETDLHPTHMLHVLSKNLLENDCPWSSDECDPQGHGYVTCYCFVFRNEQEIYFENKFKS